MLADSERASGAILASTFLLLYVPICIRFACARIAVLDNAILVANVFSSRSIRWRDIDRFQVGRWNLFPAVCLIYLSNGQVQHAFGIQERTNFPDGTAEGMAEDLNRELREHRVRSHSAS